MGRFSNSNHAKKKRPFTVTPPKFLQNLSSALREGRTAFFILFLFALFLSHFPFLLLFDAKFVLKTRMELDGYCEMLFFYETIFFDISQVLRYFALDKPSEGKRSTTERLPIV